MWSFTKVHINIKREIAVLPPFFGFSFFRLKHIMAAENHRELQLLPTPSSFSSSSSKSCFSTCRMRSDASGTGTLSKSTNQFDGGSALSSLAVDLQLSISLQPIRSPQLDCVLLGSPTDHNYGDPKSELSCIEALKWQTAEQIRLAAIEKAYAERVRELTRREMELAQSEFIRARYMSERAKEDMEKAERVREISTWHIDHSTFMEITCYSCHRRFLRQ